MFVRALDGSEGPSLSVATCSGLGAIQSRPKIKSSSAHPQAGRRGGEIEAFDLYWSSVEEVIDTTALDGDRAARAQARAA